MTRFLGRFRFSLLVLLVALLCSATTGCALFESPNKAFVMGVDQGVNASGLLDEYMAYVEKDTAIKAETKKIRLGTATELRDLIKTAKGK